MIKKIKEYREYRQLKKFVKKAKLIIEFKILHTLLNIINSYEDIIKVADKLKDLKSEDIAKELVKTIKSHENNEVK